METNFRNLNLENFEYKGEFNEIQFTLTFDKIEDSHIGFEMIYSIPNRLAVGFNEF